MVMRAARQCTWRMPRVYCLDATLLHLRSHNCLRPPYYGMTCTSPFLILGNAFNPVTPTGLASPSLYLSSGADRPSPLRCLTISAHLRSTSIDLAAWAPRLLKCVSKRKRKRNVSREEDPDPHITVSVPSCESRSSLFYHYRHPEVTYGNAWFCG